MFAIPDDFFVERPAQGLDDASFYLILCGIGVDDEPVVVGAHDSGDLRAARLPLHLDLHAHRDVVLRVLIVHVRQAAAHEEGRRGVRLAGRGPGFPTHARP